ncbi:MAG: hypothetical protein ACYTEE_00070 [Planctomycetota bacterium]|jgi:hypothetical protein
MMIGKICKENKFWIKEEEITGFLKTTNEFMRGLVERSEPRYFIVFLLLLVCTFGTIYKGLIIAGPGGGIWLLVSPAVILGLMNQVGLSLAAYHHQPLLLHVTFINSLSILWLRMGELHGCFII